MIPLTCPACQNRYQVADEFAGRAARCSHCGQSLRVPSAAPPAVSPPLPSPGAHSQPAGGRGASIVLPAVLVSVGAAVLGLVLIGVLLWRANVLGGDSAKIAVVGCPGLVPSTDKGADGDSAPLPAGTRLTVLAEDGHSLDVRSADGREGRLPRWGVCTLKEWERRVARGQVPEMVGVIVHENGSLFLRGEFRIREGNWAFEQGQAFWLGPTMLGQEVALGGRKVGGDPYVLYYADANGRCVRLPVWGHPDPDAVAGREPAEMPPEPLRPEGDHVPASWHARPDLQLVMSDLRMIGLAYQGFLAEKGAPPGSAEELIQWENGRADALYVLGPLELARAGGTIAVQWNLDPTRHPEGAANVVLAYERKAVDEGGAVLLGDGSVELMTASKLAAKRKGRPPAP